MSEPVDPVVEEPVVEEPPNSEEPVVEEPPNSEEAAVEEPVAAKLEDLTREQLLDLLQAKSNSSSAPADFPWRP